MQLDRIGTQRRDRDMLKKRMNESVQSFAFPQCSREIRANRVVAFNHTRGEFSHPDIRIFTHVGPIIPIRIDDRRSPLIQRL